MHPASPTWPWSASQGRPQRALPAMCCSEQRQQQQQWAAAAEAKGRCWCSMFLGGGLVGVAQCVHDAHGRTGRATHTQAHTRNPTPSDAPMMTAVKNSTARIMSSRVCVRGVGVTWCGRWLCARARGRGSEPAGGRERGPPTPFLHPAARPTLYSATPYAVSVMKTPNRSPGTLAPATYGSRMKLAACVQCTHVIIQ